MCIFMELFTEREKCEVWLICTHTHPNKPTHTLFMQMVCMHFHRPTFESLTYSEFKDISMRVSVT